LSEPDFLNSPSLKMAKWEIVHIGQTSGFRNFSASARTNVISSFEEASFKLGLHDSTIRTTKPNIDRRTFLFWMHNLLEDYHFPIQSSKFIILICKKGVSLLFQNWTPICVSCFLVCVCRQITGNTILSASHCSSLPSSQLAGTNFSFSWTWVKHRSNGKYSIYISTSGIWFTLRENLLPFSSIK